MWRMHGGEESLKICEPEGNESWRMKKDPNSVSSVGDPRVLLHVPEVVFCSILGVSAYVSCPRSCSPVSRTHHQNHC